MHLLYPREEPAGASILRLPQIPHFFEGLHGTVCTFADLPGEAHACEVAIRRSFDSEQLRVEIGDLGAVCLSTPLVDLRLDLSEHFRRRELTDVLEVPCIPGSLQTHEI